MNTENWDFALWALIWIFIGLRFVWLINKALKEDKEDK